MQKEVLTNRCIPEKQTFAFSHHSPFSHFQIPLVKQSCPVSTKSRQGRNCLVRNTHNNQTHTEAQIHTQAVSYPHSLCVFWMCVGQYLPSCDEEGYYRSHQCHSSSGQCWCVDRYGNEVASSRTHGPANCGKQNSECQWDEFAVKTSWT